MKEYFIKVFRFERIQWNINNAKKESKDINDWLKPPPSDNEEESVDLQPQEMKMNYKEIEEDEALKIEKEQHEKATESMIEAMNFEIEDNKKDI